MCSNAELSRIMARVERTVNSTAGELTQTRIDVAALDSRLDTWQETKCAVHDEEIKDMRGQISEVKTVATSAAMRAAGLYSLVVLILGSAIALVFKSIGA